MTTTEWMEKKGMHILKNVKRDGMLTDKQKKLMWMLVNTEKPLSAEEIAECIDSSTRTVKRYIGNLNFQFENVAQISLKRGQGYSLSGNLNEVRIALMNDVDEESTRHRRNMIFMELLCSGKMSQEDLADALYVSSSTLNKMMAGAREALEPYHLSIHSNNGLLDIIGDELDIRLLLNDIGFQYQDSSITRTFLPNISEDEFDRISDGTYEILNRNNIVVADRDMSSLISHITIALSRSKSGKSELDIELNENVRSHNYEVIFSIMHRLSKELDISLDGMEYNYVSLYSGLTIYHFENGGAAIDDEMFAFTKECLKEVAEKSGIDYLKDEKKTVALSLHLKIMLNRLRTGNVTENPLLGMIKQNYPVEMDYGILIARKLNEKYNVNVTEDEIGYLAVHLAGYRNKAKHRQRIAIVCQYGIGTSRLLQEKLSEENENIDVVGVYPTHYVELAATQDVDFVVSTVAIPDYKWNVPLIVIDNIFTEDSKVYMQKAMRKYAGRNRKFINFFDERCYMHVSGNTRSEVLTAMCKHMQNVMNIPANTNELVEEREKISSTELGNLCATPHTILTGDFRSTIMVGVLDQPIVWNKEEVQLVFMICFNQKDAVNAEAFRSLYTVMKNKNTIRQMIESSNYSEFIEILNRELCNE